MKVIKSGEVVMGRCGIPAGIDSFGEELFVGDIVHYWLVENGDVEWWSPTLSAIVESGLLNELGIKPYVMGIGETQHLLPHDLDCDHEDFSGDPEVQIDGWIVSKAKHHERCVIGEKWESFGFNYAEEDL